MPRTARPADIAKVVKAIQAVDKAWREANSTTQEERYCTAKPKPGTPIVKTLLKCHEAYKTVSYSWTSLNSSIAALSKAVSRLPAKHPMLVAGETVANLAMARADSLERRLAVLLKKEEKFIKQLKQVKHQAQTAKSAEVAKLEKAINEVIAAWGLAERRALSKNYCNARPGTKVVETLVKCNLAGKALMRSLSDLESTMETLVRAMAKVPSEHPLRLAGAAVWDYARRRESLLRYIKKTMADKEKKFIKQLE